MEIEKLIKELDFKAVRSSRAGGQNVNKVSSKLIKHNENTKKVVQKI